jgi:hypothetical protein
MISGSKELKMKWSMNKSAMKDIADVISRSLKKELLKKINRKTIKVSIDLNDTLKINYVDRQKIGDSYSRCLYGSLLFTDSGKL